MPRGGSRACPPACSPGPASAARSPEGRSRTRWDPSSWASLRPFGIGERRPNNYAELTRALRENAGELPFAWRILRDGVCDGCALGTSGLHDWTIEGIHLCNIRLRLLRLNTMPALDPAVLADVAAWRGVPGDELRALGRLPFPMVRRKGEPGFRRVSWDEALGLVADRIAAVDPTRVAFYLTNRGLGNEDYYAAQKAARAIGTNSVDTAARVCHSPSTVGLRDALGVAASTCSYADWIGADLVVFLGSNVANNQPVATKYLYEAKKAGTRVVVVNSYREPGMERYWIPSTPESALFGTRLADRFFLVNGGGDLAFLTGALKHLLAFGWVDRDFVDRHTTGFDALATAVEAQPWEQLERRAGASWHDMYDFARLVGQARTAVFVWSMGITQHAHGEDNVRAILNLALTRGFVGRERCGVMPIRGHSGVQGGAEMGAYATAFPGGLPITAETAQSLARTWGFPVPTEPGLTGPEMIDAAADGRLDVLVATGGNFLEVLPQPGHVETALARIPLRVHLDIVVSSQMLVDPADTVVLLPAATRYETPGGVTETSTERRVIFSPEIPGRRIGEARPPGSVHLDLARRARPQLAAALRPVTTPELRDEIARVVPSYAGIERLSRPGDAFQWGGPRLCEGWAFPTPDGKAHFTTVVPTEEPRPEGTFLLSTRRGKQFNTMVHEQRDGLTGAERDAVFVAAEDAARLGFHDGDEVLVRSDAGTYRGRVFLAPLRPGNVQVHWPEGNVLIGADRRSPDARVPDYNAVVRLEAVGRAPGS